MARLVGRLRALGSKVFVVAVLMFIVAACQNGPTESNEYTPPEVAAAARTPSARAKAPALRMDAARAKSRARVQAELRARAALQ